VYESEMLQVLLNQRVIISSRTMRFVLPAIFTRRSISDAEEIVY
jgi:hypothetical protein